MQTERVGRESEERRRERVLRQRVALFVLRFVFASEFGAREGLVLIWLRI